MSGTFLAAQTPYPSIGGMFTVDQYKGCTGLIISVEGPAVCGNGTPNSGSEACTIRFKSSQRPAPGYNGGTITSNADTYAQPGIYYIRMAVGAGIDNVDSIRVEIKENTTPLFQLSKCAADQVAVQILEDVYDDYDIDFNGEATLIAEGGETRNHIFTPAPPSPTNKTITVKGIYEDAADNCGSASEDVLIGTGISEPFINKLTVADKSSITLDITGQDDVLYAVELLVNGNLPYYQPKKIVNEFTTTIDEIYPDGISPDKPQFYCFRIGPHNACTNSIDATKYSNFICSADLDLTVADNVNLLNWKTQVDGTVDRLELVTNSTSGDPVTTEPLPYRDEDIICGNEYCYTLFTYYDDGSISESLQKCGIAFSTATPPAIENTSAQVNSDGVNLQWLGPVGVSDSLYSIFKSGNGGFELLAETEQSTLDDTEYQSEDGSCYQISYIDICGNQSPRSGDICPIVLTGTLHDDNSITLDWTDYTGWKDGVVEYYLEKYDKDGNLLESVPITSGLTYLDDAEDPLQQVYTYIVKATGPSSLPISISNTVTIVKSPNLFHPTAFTPNGDLLNDIFNVHGEYISEFEMQIFNRWGELMFSTTNIDAGWDGTFKGKEMPEGTYTFIAHITDLAGRTFKKSGSIVLLQKTK